MSDSNTIIKTARRLSFAVPAFNIPYLPMMRPVIEAIIDTDSFALIDVARLEWIKFKAGGVGEIAEEYKRCCDSTDARKHTRLHLDHIPVIDEDGNRVEVIPIMEEAIKAGFESVMVDGSRLALEENIAATREVVELSHGEGIPVEAELGAVLGHEEGPLPPYEELFASGRGFTDVAEAKRFVAETGADWLSVAFGNIHGAITAAERKKEKQPAKLDIAHLAVLAEATSVPLVLHGGSGIPQSYVDRAVAEGIAKINIASDIRRVYEAAIEPGKPVSDSDRLNGYRAVYDATKTAIDRLGIHGTASLIASTLDASAPDGRELEAQP